MGGSSVVGSQARNANKRHICDRMHRRKMQGLGQVGTCCRNEERSLGMQPLCPLCGQGCRSPARPGDQESSDPEKAPVLDELFFLLVVKISFRVVRVYFKFCRTLSIDPSAPQATADRQDVEVVLRQLL